MVVVIMVLYSFLALGHNQADAHASYRRSRVEDYSKAPDPDSKASGRRALRRSNAFKRTYVDSVPVSNVATVVYTLRAQSKQCPTDALTFLCEATAKKELQCDRPEFVSTKAEATGKQFSKIVQQQCVAACTLLSSFPSEAHDLCGSSTKESDVGAVHLDGLQMSHFDEGEPFDAAATLTRIKKANSERDNALCPQALHSHSTAM